ncbi:hypothetical protein EJ110_NYTH03941 [Nymphaea thermarum]|nr:hypothetical protein EJ110_NYTH03941 [Nymphaea thermarum]
MTRSGGSRVSLPDAGWCWLSSTCFPYWSGARATRLGSLSRTSLPESPSPVSPTSPPSSAHSTPLSRERLTIGQPRSGVDGVHERKCGQVRYGFYAWND